MIGVGWFGRFTLEEYVSIPDIRVTALCDRDIERCREAAAPYGARAYSEPMELIASPDVDIVVIATTPATHAFFSIAAARAGKHVFCEKPLAVSLEEAAEVRRAVEENGVRLTINYVLRPNPFNRRLRDLLRSGIMGPLHHMALENYATDEPLKPGHWFWDREESAGIWIEHGVHFFNLFEWLSGERAVEISATGRTRPDGAHDRVWCMARYSGNLTATYYHGFTQPQRFEETVIRLACVRGYVELFQWIQTRMTVDALVDEEGLELLREWAGTDLNIVERYTGSFTGGWAYGGPYRATARARVELTLPQGKFPAYREAVRANMSDFVRAVRDPEYLPEITFEDGRTSLAAAVAATRAERSGGWEKVE